MTLDVHLHAHDKEDLEYAEKDLGLADHQETASVPVTL